MGTHTRSTLAALVLVALAAFIPAAARAVVPANGMAPVLTPVSINANVGDQSDPHVSGDWAAYTDGVSIRYYNFVSTADAQIPMGTSARDMLSDISGSKIVFSRTITGVKTALMVFDAVTATAPVEIDAAPATTRLGSAIGADTVAYVDYGLHGNGEIVIHDLVTSTSQRITNDASFDQNPSVSPSGAVVVWEHCALSMGNCDIWQAVRSGTIWTVSETIDTVNPEANPDTNGTVVVYDSQRGGNSDVFWRPVAGGPEQQLQLASDERNPSIACSFIGFESRNLLGTSNIFTYSVVSNRLYQITSNPVVNHELSDLAVLSDGRIRMVWASDEAGFDQRNVKGGTFSLGSGGADACGPVDTVAPVLTVPAPMTVNATAPAGAAVTYTATATDDVTTIPTVSCAPASGATFPTGTTTVACTATDAASNTATASFTVTVLGATAQIADLIDKTLAYLEVPALQAPFKTRLQAAIDAAVAGNKPAACAALQLYVFIVQIAPPTSLTAAEKAELIADAKRIRAVLGC
jgi:HYR domain